MTPENASLASSIALLTEAERTAVLSELTDDELAALEHDWRFWARRKQLPPDGDWFAWILLAGRGFGKTRAGAEWIRERGMAGDRRRRMLIAGRTPADVRDYCLEGPGGLLTNCPPWIDLDYEPSKRLITFPTGATAHVRSGANPDEFRGFGGDTAWLDEFAAWDYPEQSWSNLTFGMREAVIEEPRACITTTPRPIPILKRLVEREWSAVVSGSTYENRMLSERWLETVVGDVEGTRIGRQEIYAEILDDVPGALWERIWIEDSRAQERDPKQMADHCTRIVIAVDPAGSTGEHSSETGVVVAGRDQRGHGYVLDDRTGRMSPREWALEAVAAYEHFVADKIVGERNFGGDLVESNLRAVDPNIPVEVVVASRGKQQRAQPVANLYEQGKIHHVGAHPELEDQMCTWDPDEPSSVSPDRVDALVWAFTDLLLGEDHGPVVEHSYAYDDAGGFAL